MRIPRVLSTLLIITFPLAWNLLPARAAAQVREDPFTAPAHIDFVDGQALLEREGQLDPADNGMPFIPGDRLRTTAGRVEVIFPDGTVLDLDEYSSVDLQDATLLRLTSGRLLLTVAGATDPARATLFQIDTPVGSAATEGPGEYRIALLSNPTGLLMELAVARGIASLRTERGSMPVRAGERSLAREFEAPSYPQVFNSARYDAFDEWAAAQRDLRLGAGASNGYLPSELQMYGGTLARSGSWAYDASFGYVWYPSVDATWRPYYRGYWSAIRPYGWTWIGVDTWAWPTHHYGRWGYVGSRWFWIPHNRWGPAWVSWGVSGGYVAWSPLGYNNRPAFGLSVSIGNRWNGWVVVPHGYFNTHRTQVRHHAVAPTRLSGHAFVAQSVPPVAPHYAVPRRRSGVAAAAISPGSRGADDFRSVQPRTRASQSAAERQSTSQHTESGRALTRAATGPSSATGGRPPVARSPQATTRRLPADARASTATAPGSAVRRGTRPFATPQARGTGSSPAERAPALRRQPDARTRQPITANPGSSAGGRSPTVETNGVSSSRPSRAAAIARRPPVSTAGASSRSSAESVTQSTREAVDRNLRSSPGPSAPRGTQGVRRGPGRQLASPPPHTSTSSPARAARTPPSPSGSSRAGASDSRGVAPQQPRARARSPQAGAPSGGMASPPRATARDAAGARDAGASSGRRETRGSAPDRAPAARRGR